MTDITEHNGVEFMRWGTITPALYFTALATSTSALLMFVSIAAYRPVVGVLALVMVPVVWRAVTANYRFWRAQLEMQAAVYPMSAKTKEKRKRGI